LIHGYFLRLLLSLGGIRLNPFTLDVLLKAEKAIANSLIYLTLFLPLILPPPAPPKPPGGNKKGNPALLIGVDIGTPIFIGTGTGTLMFSAMFVSSINVLSTLKTSPTRLVGVPMFVLRISLPMIKLG